VVAITEATHKKGLVSGGGWFIPNRLLGGRWEFSEFPSIQAGAWSAGRTTQI